MKSEEGFSLIEVSVSVMILALLGLAFFSASATSIRATLVMDERTTAKNLACSQMEYVESQGYDSAGLYERAVVPDGFLASITAERLHDDDDIQKITVSIEHNEKVVTTLEAYRASR